MRRRSATHLSRTLFAALSLMLTASLGCWEQWSQDWFPQMKWQKAVQAFEAVEFGAQGSAAFMPPEGTIPIHGGEAPVSNLIDAASDGLVNPTPRSLISLNNGKDQYKIFCSPCHGVGGLGDGPVSMMGARMGPIAAVLPIAGAGSVAAIRSDGHLYTTIRYGRRRMPGYARIPADDRWDIVNYIRYMNGMGVQ